MRMNINSSEVSSLAEELLVKYRLTQRTMRFPYRLVSPPAETNFKYIKIEIFSGVSHTE